MNNNAFAAVSFSELRAGDGSAAIITRFSESVYQTLPFRLTKRCGARKKTAGIKGGKKEGIKRTNKRIKE